MGRPQTKTIKSMLAVYTSVDDVRLVSELADRDGISRNKFAAKLIREGLERRGLVASVSGSTEKKEEV